MVRASSSTPHAPSLWGIAGPDPLGSRLFKLPRTPNESGVRGRRVVRARLRSTAHHAPRMADGAIRTTASRPGGLSSVHFFRALVFEACRSVSADSHGRLLRVTPTFVAPEFPHFSANALGGPHAGTGRHTLPTTCATLKMVFGRLGRCTTKIALERSKRSRTKQ